MPHHDRPSQDRTENRFSRHPVLWLSAIVFVCFVAFVAVGETILAHMNLAPGFEPAPQHRYIRLREWVPNAAFVEKPPNIRFANPGGPVQNSYRIETDQHGFIAPGAVHDEPDVEIVFVGGSTTETLFVSTEKRFPFLAGRLLEQRTGKRVNSFNGGKSGNNAMHSTFVLQAKVLPMKPDFVVLMHAANDIGVLNRSGTYWAEDNEFGLLLSPEDGVKTAFRIIRDATIPRSYRVFRHASGSAANLVGFGKARASAAIAMAEWGGDFRSALSAFVRTAQAWGIRPVLMTQAVETRDLKHPDADDGGAYLAPKNLARAGFTPESFASTEQYFNAITREVAQETGAILIDLEQAYPWSRNELYDGLHYSDAGSEIVAGLIADALSDAVATPPAR